MTDKQPGQVLKDLRESRGWSIPQLAKRAGVSHTTIRNYESGARHDGSDFQPNEGKVMKVAAAFPPEERATILSVFGYEDRARAAKSQVEPEDPPEPMQQFTVVGPVGDSKDTIIVRDEKGRHRIFREVRLDSSPRIYGPDEAPF